MPGNPFKAPARPRSGRPAASRPSKPNPRSYVPAPEIPNGRSSKSKPTPKGPAAKVTTKARRSIRMPSVRQGARVQ